MHRFTFTRPLSPRPSPSSFVRQSTGPMHLFDQSHRLLRHVLVDVTNRLGMTDYQEHLFTATSGKTGASTCPSQKTKIIIPRTSSREYVSPAIRWDRMHRWILHRRRMLRLERCRRILRRGVGSSHMRRRGEGWWCGLKLGRDKLRRGRTPLPLPIRLIILEGWGRGWLVAQVSV